MHKQIFSIDDEGQHEGLVEELWEKDACRLRVFVQKKKSWRWGDSNSRVDQLHNYVYIHSHPLNPYEMPTGDERR